MKPKNTTTPQEGLLRNRLDNMINNQHKLVKLSQLIDWQSFEDDWGKLFLSDQGAHAIPKGEIGDMQNVIFCATGHSLRKILNTLPDSAKDFLAQIFWLWFFYKNTFKSLKLGLVIW